MFNKFSEEALRVINISKNEMLDLKHEYLGTEHIMLGILKTNNSVSKYFKKNKVDYKVFKNEIIKLLGYGDNREELILFTPVVKEIFERAIDISEENNNVVTIENIFVSMLEIGDSIAYRTIKSLNMNIDTIYKEFTFILPKKSKKMNVLNSVGVNFVDKANSFDPVIGREEEIKEIIGILSRKNKSNPLLIGDAGVGKTAIVEEISRLIKNGNICNKLRNKKIINIDMSSLVAGTKYRGEFEEKINNVIKEAEDNDDVILFIDEIHTLVGAGGAEGAIDASNIFKPALARGKIKVIGATTIDEYKKFIEKDKALERRFKKVYINEPSNIKDIIYKLKPIYENYHQVSISNNLVDLIIELTDKYIHNYKNPDKTIDILDEVCARASIKSNPNIDRYNELSIKLKDIIEKKKDNILNNNFKEAYKLKEKENIINDELNRLELILSTKKNNHVTRNDIIKIFESKTNFKINNISKKELIKELNNNVLAQELPINKFVDAYFESIKNDKLTSILLTGSTGVGKSLLVDTLSKITNRNLITINMNEYTDNTCVTKLIGSNAGYVGYEDTNYVFNTIRDYPYSIILIDNIDNSIDSITKIFSSIMTNNYIKDNKGNIIRFNHCLLVFTITNKGKSGVGFGIRKVDCQGLDSIDDSLLNGIDHTINMNKLSEKDIINIINYKSKKGLSRDKIDVIVKESDYQNKGAKMVENLLKKHENDKKMKKKCKNYSKN